MKQCLAQFKCSIKITHILFINDILIIELSTGLTSVAVLCQVLVEQMNDSG